jgi:hypothetical protein
MKTAMMLLLYINELLKNITTHQKFIEEKFGSEIFSDLG